MTQVNQVNANDQFIVIYRQQLYIEPGKAWRLLLASDLSLLSLEQDEMHYVGEYRSAACYALTVKGDVDEQCLAHGRAILGGISHEVFSLVSRALQLVTWKQQHQFCGQCGGPTQSHDKESAQYCPSCDLFFYPRISPCMMCLVTKGDYLLLAQHEKHRAGFYATLAGFVEAGETVEETVHREVREEVGLSVGGLRYFKTQAWPFPHQLMIGFFADYVSGDIQIDDEEITDAQWFHYSQLPEVPPAESLSGMMIHTFVEQRQALTDAECKLISYRPYFFTP